MTTFVGTAEFKPRESRDKVSMFFITQASTERNAVRAARKQMREDFEIRKNGPIKVNVRQSTLHMSE